MTTGSVSTSLVTATATAAAPASPPIPITVNPLAPTLAPVAETGLEGSPIALDLGASINGLAGDANALASLVVSAIPVGATLSAGPHTFTAGAGSTAVDVAGWNLASLTVTSASDATFTLGIAAPALDAEGHLRTLTPFPYTTPFRSLAPTLAPVAETGLEGSPIALDLGASINGLAGDANALASLVVSAIPV